MHDIQIVHLFQTVHSLNQYSPDLGLSEKKLKALALSNHFKQVAFVCILHDNTTNYK